MIFCSLGSTHISMTMDTSSRSNEETTTELEQVVVVTPTEEKTACPDNQSSSVGLSSSYNGIEKGGNLYFNKIIPKANKAINNKQNGRLYLSPSDNSVDSVGVHYGRGGYLSPLDIASDDEGGGRRRHKSEGSVHVSPSRSDHLIPNKKNSMYESRSTISGVRFDDSYIGKFSSTIYNVGTFDRFIVLPQFGKDHVTFRYDNLASIFSLLMAHIEQCIYNVIFI